MQPLTLQRRSQRAFHPPSFNVTFQVALEVMERGKSYPCRRLIKVKVPMTAIHEPWKDYVKKLNRNYLCPDLRVDQAQHRPNKTTKPEKMNGL